MGDVLFTSGALRGTPVYTPSYLGGADHIFRHSNFNPAGYRQKVSIITPTLITALAGGQNQMFSFVRSLNAFFGKGDPTQAEISSFVKSYDPDKKSNLSGFVMHAQLMPGDQVKYGITPLGHPRRGSHAFFESIHAWGSGAASYVEILSKSLEKISGFGGRIAKAEDLRFKLVQNLMCAAGFLAQEIVAATTLTKAWGVAFELAYFADQKFQKLDDVTFSFISASYSKRTRKIENIKITHCMKYYYHMGSLIIRALGAGKEKYFTILPLDSDKLDISLPNDADVVIPSREFNSICNVVTYLTRLPNGRIDISPMVIFNDAIAGPNPRIRYQGKGKELHIMLDESANLHLEQWLETRVGQ